MNTTKPPAVHPGGPSSVLSVIEQAKAAQAEYELWEAAAKENGTLNVTTDKDYYARFVGPFETAARRAIPTTRRELRTKADWLSTYLEHGGARDENPVITSLADVEKFYGLESEEYLIALQVHVGAIIDGPEGNTETNEPGVLGLKEVDMKKLLDDIRAAFHRAADD